MFAHGNAKFRRAIDWGKTTLVREAKFAVTEAVLLFFLLLFSPLLLFVFFFLASPIARLTVFEVQLFLLLLLLLLLFSGYVSKNLFGEQ